MANSAGSGFSLIEVLVALAILAIALIALIDNQMESIAHLTKLRDKSVAHWTAINIANQIRLQTLGKLGAGTKTGRSNMLGGSWEWQAQLSQVDSSLKNWLQITVTVKSTHGSVKDTYVTYASS